MRASIEHYRGTRFTPSGRSYEQVLQMEAEHPHRGPEAWRLALTEDNLDELEKVLLPLLQSRRRKRIEALWTEYARAQDALLAEGEQV